MWDILQSAQGASWLYNFLLGILKGQVENMIDNALTNTITQNVDVGINSALVRQIRTEMIEQYYF